jgi:RNA polymerase sigma-70 factor (ECF subfamily)
VVLGWNEPFPTTNWTDILDVGLGDEARRQAALEKLSVTYWRPVYYYLRCKGHDHEEAKDLTQGFFHEVVVGRHLVQQARREKGRFRTFLLTALERYAVSAHRAATAKQRLPEGGLLRLEEIDSLKDEHLFRYPTPSDAFDYGWALALLDQVIAQVAEECHERGKDVHWEVFQAKVLQPILTNVERPSLVLLCEKYGIRNNITASNMIVTVKRRFQSVLRRHVRYFVSSESEVDDEIRHFMRILCRRSAGS